MNDEAKKNAGGSDSLDELVSFEDGGKEMYERYLLVFGSAYGYGQDGKKYYIPTYSVFFSNAKSKIQS